MGTGQEIGANHLETVTSSLVRAEHQGRRFDRLFDNGNLAFVEFEINDVGRLCVLSGEVFFYLVSKFLFWHLLSRPGPMQRIEAVSVGASHLDQFHCFGPSDLWQILLDS